MDYTDYYKKISAKKQISKLAKKYKNKKIVIYGAGLMSEILFENYDLKKLNITAVCDNKYNVEKSPFFGYKTISPDELADFDCDVILVNLRYGKNIANNIKYNLLIDTKNENVCVKTMFSIPFLFCLKEILR